MSLVLQKHDWTESYLLEAKFRYIISEQEHYGWKMDKDLMLVNQKDLQEQLLKLYDKIREVAPKKITNEKEIKAPLLKSGQPSTALVNWYNNLDTRMFSIDSVIGAFTRINIEPINPSSASQRIQALLKTNWRPTEWNYKKDKYGKTIYINRQPTKTSPKLTDDSVLNHKLGQLMVLYTQMQHRASLVTGLIEKLREDNTLGGGANTVGTNTGRCQHRVIANIPRPDSFYGDQIRGMFSVRDGYVLLGADLTAMENRLIGHYTHSLDGGIFAKRLLTEDPHNKTMELFREAKGIVIDRSTAKTVNYALNFGAGIEKLKAILDCNEQIARALHKVWWDDKKVILRLKEILETAVEKRNPAWVKGLDGRKIYLRNKKDIVNALIQGAGSIVNKYVTVAVDNKIKAQGVDAHLVLNYHDEINYEILKKDLDIIKQIVYSSLEECNNHFKFNVPMTMDIKIGLNWREVH